jgi:hypothetical protein
VYRKSAPARRERLAGHELRELRRMDLVVAAGRAPHRWSPALFAGEALRLAGRA